MTNQLLAGKTGLIFGVANKRSIAWAIAKAWHDAGANLIFNYQGERVKGDVEELTAAFGDNVTVAPHPKKRCRASMSKRRAKRFKLRTMFPRIR